MEDCQQPVTSVSTMTLWSRNDCVNNVEGDKCGCCSFYPKYVQRFANPRVFLVFFCIKNILQGMIFTYIVGIETSLEKHFQFDGRTIGLLLTLGEIGPIVTSVWISHLGSRGNRPRWMAIGLLLVAFSLLICFFMYLLFPSPPLTSGSNGSLVSYEKSNQAALCEKSFVESSNSTLSSNKRYNCTIDPTRRRWAFAAWTIIYSIMGIGATTVYVIGAPYLDDSIPSNDSPFYFGPVLGYLLSSICLKLYVDLNKHPGFKSEDPRWVGAWWLGALILALIISIFALAIASFPKTMNQKKVVLERENICDVADIATPTTAAVQMTEVKAETQTAMQNGQLRGTTEFKEAVVRLLRNPILLCSSSSSVFTILGLAGYFIWLPKYFEHEFRLSKSNSAMYSGLAGNFSMIFGVILSGYWMKRYRPTSTQVAAIVAASKYIYAFGLLVIMLIADCGFMSDLPGVLQTNGILKLDRDCNNECSCKTYEFLPICLQREPNVTQTYFSPCHAGCTGFSSLNGSEVYHSCSCDPSSSVKEGFCKGTCNNLYIYMLLLASIKLIVSFSAVGNLIIDLRCVEERDKALALGFIAMTSGLFGFLPNPIIYGTLIDSSCLIWETSCEEKGSCWVYNTDEFRYKLHGLTSGCLMIAGMFEVITYFKVKGLLLFRNT